MKINEELLVFNYIIGKTIAQWGHVELHLLETALACVGSIPDRQAFAVAYHSIEGFRQKLGVCHNVIAHKFGKSQHFPKWERLRNTLAKSSHNRNKLAHGWHKYYPNATVGRRWAIIPIHHENGTLVHVTGTKPPSVALCVRDLFGIHQNFHDLTGKMANMHHLFSRNQAPFPESLGQPKNLPTIQNIKALIHGELGFQFAPSRRKP